MNALSRSMPAPHARDALGPTALQRSPTLLLVGDGTAREDTRMRLLAAHDADILVVTAGLDGDPVLRPDLVAWVPAAAEDLDRFREGLARVRARFPGHPVVVMGAPDDPRLAREALRGACRGYLPARLDAALLAAGLRLVLAGGLFVPDGVLADTDAGPDPDIEAPGIEASRLALTERETEVLHRLKRGLQNKIIAFELGISQSTVKVHVRSIMRKTAATNRTQVAFLTRRLVVSSGGAAATPVGAHPETRVHAEAAAR